MKIYNNPVKINNYSITNTNFKGAKISPVALKKVETLKNNPATREIFIKLASVIGLTALISWFKSLSENKNDETMSKLDLIDQEWISKNNEKLLNPEFREQFLDLTSSIDETESILWTKGLITKQENAKDVETKKVNKEAENLFLSKDSNETFMAISANKAIDSILMQINALNSVDEKTRESFVKDIENKLNNLVKQADSLQNDITKSELYTKLANIAKAFTIYNILTGKEDDKPEILEVPSKEVEEVAKETPATVENIPKIEEEIKEEKKVTEIKTVTPAAPVELPVTVPDKIEIPEEMKPSVSVIGKIDLKDDGKRRFKPTPSSTESATKVPKIDEIKITDKNREFVEEVFLKSFKKTSEIKPETYSGHIEMIQKIYESYSDEKEKLKKNFLLRLSEKDMRHLLNNYLDFTNGKESKIDFMTFLKLEEFKEANGGEITKKEFEIINNYKDVSIKYLQYNDDKIRVVFNPGVSAEKRLEVIRDIHRIAYNIESSKQFKGVNIKEFAPNDVIHELSYRLAKDSTQYPNIVRFLNIDIDELPATETSLENENDSDDEKMSIDYKENFEDIKENLNNAKYRTRISELADALNNEAFDGLMDSSHARMRFIERYVLGSDSRLLSKNAYEVKKKTSKKIETLKQNIEEADAISFINYPTKDSSKPNQKYGPRIFVKGCTIGLNDKAQIHTIWDV